MSKACDMADGAVSLGAQGSDQIWRLWWQGESTSTHWLDMIYPLLAQVGVVVTARKTDPTSLNGLEDTRRQSRESRNKRYGDNNLSIMFFLAQFSEAFSVAPTVSSAR